MKNISKKQNTSPNQRQQPNQAKAASSPVNKRNQSPSNRSKSQEVPSRRRNERRRKQHPDQKVPSSISIPSKKTKTINSSTKMNSSGNSEHHQETTNSSLTMKLLGSQPFSPVAAGSPRRGQSAHTMPPGFAGPLIGQFQSHPSGERILAPHTNDILCGRGGSINAHPGNRVFRSWIQDYKSTYNLASTKAEKSRVVNIILDKVRKLNPPGRFLQKVSTNSSAELCMANSDDGWWEEIDEVKAMAKISQALREGAPAFRAAHGKGKGNKNKEQSSRRRSSTGGVAMSAGAKPSKRKSTLDKHISFETSPKIKRRSSMANANPSPDVDAKASPSPPTAGHVPFSHDTDQHMHDHDLEIGELNNIFAFNNDSDELAIGNDNGKAMENVKSQGMISKGAPPLEPHPLVPNSDFNASIADVAAAIPPTPPTVKKQSVASLYHENAFGNVITPHLQPSSSTPPPVSPYETAQAGPGLMSPTHHWDPLAFFSPTTPKAVTNLNSEKIGEQSLIKTPSSFYMNRTHSLSLSDLNDFHGSELGEFTNPFENEDELKCAKSSSNSSGGGCAGRPGINSCAPLSKPPLLDLQNRRHSLNFQPGYSQMLPPPYTKTVTSNIMGSTQVPPSTHIGAPPFNLPFGNIPPPSPMDSLPPRGLSFGRLGSVPKGYLGRKSTSSSVSRDSTNASSIGKRNQNNVRRHDSSSTEKDSKKSMNTGVPNSFLCYEHFRSVMH